MFKNIERGFSKFFTNERIIMLVVFLILAWGLMTYSGFKNYSVDNMTNASYENMSGGSSHEEMYERENMYEPLVNSTSNQSSMNTYAHTDATIASPVTNSQSSSLDSLHPVANPSDLLPNDSNSQWAALNPNTMNKGDVLMPDLLQAGYHIGLDTIGQTLRNANLQLRSDPIIPKSIIGPWNQSTIEPDLGRVPLELAQGQQ